jgi:LemA protein
MISLIVIVGLYILSIYNGLVKLKNRVKEAWSDTEMQMKRRYDLIPSLVEIVKGYASHEKNTFNDVIKARNDAMKNVAGVVDKAQSENVLSGTLKSLFALSENYPNLKANENFLELQKELIDTENKIQASRRFYNLNVLAMNTKLESFPGNIIGNVFNFIKQDFFSLGKDEKKEKETVKISF